MSAAWLWACGASEDGREERLSGGDEHFNRCPCLVGVGSKERSSLFLAVVSTSHRRREGLEWLALSCDSGGGGTVEW